MAASATAPREPTASSADWRTLSRPPPGRAAEPAPVAGSCAGGVWVAGALSSPTDAGQVFGQGVGIGHIWHGVGVCVAGGGPDVGGQTSPGHGVGMGNGVLVGQMPSGQGVGSGSGVSVGQTPPGHGVDVETGIPSALASRPGSGQRAAEKRTRVTIAATNAMPASAMVYAFIVRLLVKMVGF